MEDLGHEEADLGGGEKLARALAGALGEFAQEVFVAASEEVGLDVFQAEAVAGIGEDFDDAAQGGVADLAFAAGADVVEVHLVDDAEELGVLAGDGAGGGGDVFAEAGGFLALGPGVGGAAGEDGPAGLGREVEADEGVVGLDQGGGGIGVAVGLGEAGDLVVEDVGKAFEEDEGEEVVLELGRVLLATNGAGGVPEHLLHGFVAEDGGAGEAAAGAGGIFDFGC